MSVTDRWTASEYNRMSPGSFPDPLDAAETAAVDSGLLTEGTKHGLVIEQKLTWIGGPGWT
jgi:hypothetical protein